MPLYHKSPELNTYSHQGSLCTSAIHQNCVRVLRRDQMQSMIQHASTPDIENLITLISIYVKVKRKISYLNIFILINGCQS
jgi:hypothetical protein